MAWGRPAQLRLGIYNDADNLDDWMAQRNAEVARRRALENAGRDAWDQSTLSGENLAANQPSDLVALGANAMGESGSAEDRASAQDGSQMEDAESLGTPSAAAGGNPSQTSVVSPSAEDSSSPPSARYVIARHGDNISRLLGTSDPGAIGRFLNLNGMDGGNSTLYAGRTYVLPNGADEASPDETAAGSRLLQRDNARAAAFPTPQAANDQFSKRLNAGLNVWTGEPAATSLPGGPKDQPSPADGGFVDRLNHSELAKMVAREGALRAGWGLGVIRGGANMVSDTIQTVGFAERLMNPFEDLVSPPGKSARRQVGDAIHRGLQYADKVKRSPSVAVDDLKGLAAHAAQGFVPEATPEADTATGEFARVLPIGANQGELAANVGALFLGGEAAEGARAIGAASKAFDASKFADAYPRAAEYFDAPYRGDGHHYFSQNEGRFSKLGGVALPKWLQELPIPQVLRDNEILRFRPEGMSRAEVLTRHVQVDPQYFGGSISADYGGGGWSAMKLGINRLSPAGRMWYGASPQLKATVGVGALAGSGAGSYLNDWLSPSEWRLP